VGEVVLEPLADRALEFAERQPYASSFNASSWRLNAPVGDSPVPQRTCT
jgi:hypothetical protein